jgi:hypothetical protein
LIEREVLESFQRLSRKLGVPPPRVVFTDDGNPYYVNGTVYIPRIVPREMVERVVAHEFAHHLHEVFGVPCRTRECETFASIFEEVWVKMRERGYNYPTIACKCGFRMLGYPGLVRCPKCGRLYRVERAHGYPEGGLVRRLVIGGVTAVGTYYLSRWLTQHPYFAENTKRRDKAAALAGGIVGFLLGYVL